MKRRFRKTIDNLQLTIDRLNIRAYRFPSGQSLIEVVIGISVVVILAISLVTTTLISQKAARSARNTTQATKLAQETIEQVRVLRDRKGFDQLPVNQVCLEVTNPNDPLTWGLNGCSDPQSIPNSIFSRIITICYDEINCTGPPTNQKLVTVTINWEEAGGTQTVTNKTILTNWCPGGITPGTPCL
ncbi:hypothetical protein A2165_04255 [Candidatus Curtissbacteria bacterium RBG_13_40_7]|uniref:Type II secretion system protein n=1 Tax=Candidatus Curtissbacteria bacterium RBG_13_40_7 TaxID=1797706 RepID=A0A1F5FUC4_9BACT|nr:MAG: hypothetical protein A2165_04255 [Candidatus Curtissbacteria bacterium RBG_13_40_7]